MLELEAKEVKLTNAVVEVIERETDNQRAIDLDFEIEGHNSLLVCLDKQLKTSFYRKATKTEREEALQGDLDLEDNHTPMLKFPSLKKAIIWDYKSDGYTLKIHQGLDPKQTYEEFDDCRVSGIKFLCKEGGSVKIWFCIRVLPTDPQVAKLFNIVKEIRPISLTPPTA